MTAARSNGAHSPSELSASIEAIVDRLRSTSTTSLRNSNIHTPDVGMDMGGSAKTEPPADEPDDAAKAVDTDDDADASEEHGTGGEELRGVASASNKGTSASDWSHADGTDTEADPADASRTFHSGPDFDIFQDPPRDERRDGAGRRGDHSDRNGERLRPIDLNDLFNLEIRSREMVLAPIIPEKGLVMVYASRGTGKTHVALGIGYAVATGGQFLRWSAPRPRRVLLIDGEMPASALRERLLATVAASPKQVAPGMFGILAGDLVETGIGNLGSKNVQAELDRWLEGVELLILDNLSSLTAVLRDNEAASWTPIQDWLLSLRRRGISVLIVHHAGKGGEQRGTSRREDVLDTSISLRRPTDYVPTQGARFEVHIEKRGIHGDEATPFEAKLEVRDTRAEWTMVTIQDVQRARIAALLEDGLSVRDIADETGIPKSTVHRLKKAIETMKGGTDDPD